MSVHYKFKSGKEKQTVIFDGLHISVMDLKRAIMQQKKIGKSADLDLQITNPQTGEVYESDSALIPKNTSVEVARVPVTQTHKKSRDRLENNSSIGANSPSHLEVEKITKSSNISTSYSTEEEKIKAMMSQSTQEYDPSKYVKNRGHIGPLPSNYTCYRCGQPGHYIKQCPTNNTDVKRSTGIPRSFMIPANADQKGALLTASGDYAVPIIDHEAYKEIKKEKPPFMPSNDSDVESELIQEIPLDLKCTLCQNLLLDAVLIPCCGNSYCDECIRSVLLESESHECPTCHEQNVSPDTLIPNRYLRTSVTKFKNDTGYDRDNKYVLYSTTRANNSANSTLSAKPVDPIKVDIKQNDNKVEEVLKTEDIFIKMESEVNENELKSQSSPQLSSQSSPTPEIPVIAETNVSTDVTMDEVILGSPKIEEKSEKSVELKCNDVEPPVPTEELTIALKPIENEVNNTSIDDGTESPQESATGPNTPLVDEPSDSYESTVEPTNSVMDVNSVQTLAPYPTQPLMSMSMYTRPPPPRMVGPIRTIRTTMGQQSNQTLLSRPPAILPHPRGVYSRPGMAQDVRNFGPMGYPRGYPMAMNHSMAPYGYAPQMRPPAHYDPYGYMGPRSHLPSGHMHHQMGLQGMAEAPPPGSAPIMTDSHYLYPKPEYDDYEDRLNRFTRQLESKSRGRPKRTRSISRSRSRTNSRSSRTRSTSTSSSTSSSSSSRSSRFSFSSRSFSGSSRSRSRSYSPRRRSRSRSHYRRRSRSPSPRHREYGRDVRYRRSRSPHYNDSRRYGDRNRGRYEREVREREPKYRDSKNDRRYERNETTYRSSHRSDDRKKETKQSHSSRCNHRSTHDKTRTTDDNKHQNRSKTPLKDEPIDSKGSEAIVKTEQTVDSNKASNEVKVENELNRKSESNQKESVSENVEKIKSEKDTEIEEKNSNKPKKSRDKTRKHHKHHHHNHHHKHRKSTDENKESKRLDDMKSSSSAKRTKKSKKSETDSKPIEETKAVKEVKTTEPKQTLVESKSVLEPQVSEDLVNYESINPAVGEYEPEFVSINPSNESIITDYVLTTDLVESVENNIINDYEILTNELEPKLEEVIDFSNEYISEGITDYNDIQLNDNQLCLIPPVEVTSDQIIGNGTDALMATEAIPLVDYTDNEELVEQSIELGDKRDDIIDDIIINAENDININCDELVKSCSPIGTELGTTAVEVPKSKWDEDINDLRFEEDYSDFEDNTKVEAEVNDAKSSSSAPKKSLPNDIIEKAEKAILEKPLRAALTVDTKRSDKSSSGDHKKHKTSKIAENSIKKSTNESNGSEKVKEKSRDKDRADSVDRNDELSDDKNGEGGDGSVPRKVKLDRSKFAEKPTLSITIDNCVEKESKSGRDRKSDDNHKESKSRHSSSHYKRSSRERSKDRESRSGDKSRKKSSKSSKSRDESRHRSHKRSRRSRSRSASPVHKLDKKHKSLDKKSDDRNERTHDESSSSYKKSSKSRYSSNSSNKRSK